MYPHPTKEYLLFRVRHTEDCQRADQQQMLADHPPAHRSYLRPLLCGLGRKLSQLGHHLEQEFALPDIAENRHVPQGKS